MSSMIDIKDIQTQLIPQELWLIEEYIRPEYFKKMVDAWQRMVEIADDALEDYMAHIPSNYRRRHVSEQPDVVWGGRVLPNFRGGLVALQNSFIQLKNGDYDMQVYGGGIHSAIRGASDYDHDWLKDQGLNARMGFDVYGEFMQQQDVAWHYALNISPTFSGGWHNGSLTKTLLPTAHRGYDITLPSEWPTYRLNPLVQCVTGEPVPKSGIYVPAEARSCANFLALILDNPDATPTRVGDRESADYGQADTIWTLVERVSDTGGGKVECRVVTQAEIEAGTQELALSAMPNTICTKAGIWLCPNDGLREITMQVGDKFPDNDRGLVGGIIWYWKSV